MNEHEVGEMLGMLVDKYPTMPVDDKAMTVWENSFYLVDAETGFTAAAMWISVHTDYPNVADLHDVVYRVTHGVKRAHQVAYEAYVAECRRQGRKPNETLWRSMVS